MEFKAGGVSENPLLIGGHGSARIVQESATLLGEVHGMIESTQRVGAEDTEGRQGGSEREQGLSD